MQYGFYFDQSRCIGCYTCIAACRSWNQLGPEAPDLIDIVTREEGEFPNVSLSQLFLTCFHCSEPTCVTACPEGVLVKRAADGIVVVEKPELCTGCELCVQACPYDAVKLAGGAKTTILKCNLCLDRLAEGKAPACVAACPTEALDVGPMDQLVVKYGNLRELQGFADYRQTRPSVIFRRQGTTSPVRG
ncbi:MAG: 4Fe-4S dicluster domain-containing protein [Chloroflexi bacterium]|nr:4Fe-4S dicluster domain-containing protein [Chloroflexota bacterium]